MSFWDRQSVLVTGATGLLGSAVVEKLLQHNALVTCLVRDWVPTSRLISDELMARTQVVRGELEDYDVLVRTLNEYEIDTVFHIGAQTIVGTAARSALSTFEANIRGTWNLLEACRTVPKFIKRIVVASSDKAYGCHEVLPYTEEAPLRGLYPYDVSKSCADLIAMSYFHTYGLPLAVTRCGNLFGAGDLNFNRLIPGTIRSALRNERPIIRSDGSYIRDYFYVEDAALAYLALAERVGETVFTGQAFNFGNESPLSVLDVVDLILRRMNQTDLVPIILNEATHEIPKQYLDCSKARRLLDWAPQFPVDLGLDRTIEWYRGYFARRGAR